MSSLLKREAKSTRLPPREIIYDIPEKPMVIVVPSYNNAKNYLKNLKSIINQNYTNYRLLYFDDASKDNTYNLVKTFLAKSGKMRGKYQILANRQNQKQSYAKYIASKLCEDTEIMVILDGDDWLAHRNVLKVLNQVYSQKNVWVTYGSFQYLQNGKYKPGTFVRQIPSNIINRNAYRNHKFCTSHLKTCYAWLYKQIPLEYVLYKDASRFLPFLTDFAEMICLIELAGHRNKCIPNYLYIYNVDNSIKYSNSWYNNKSTVEAKTLKKYIRNMPRLSPLKTPIWRKISLNKRINIDNKVVLFLGSQVNKTQLNPGLSFKGIKNLDWKTILASLNAIEYYLIIENNEIDINMGLLEMAMRYMETTQIDTFLLDLVKPLKSFIYLTPNSKFTKTNVGFLPFRYAKLKSKSGLYRKSGIEKIIKPNKFNRFCQRIVLTFG